MTENTGKPAAENPYAQFYVVKKGRFTVEDRRGVLRRQDAVPQDLRSQSRPAHRP
jgi:hypothetical protein